MIPVLIDADFRGCVDVTFQIRVVCPGGMNDNSLRGHFLRLFVTIVLRGVCGDNLHYRINSLGLFIVDSKVKKINGKRINSLDNNTLGDIDVLVINPKKEKIIVIEVKNFGFSKTPYEMHQEYLRIFCDNGEKLCYISKHKRRVEWIKTHIDDVLIQYDLQKGKWKVDDLLILNEAIISNEYYHKNQKTLLYTDIDKKSMMNI